MLRMTCYILCVVFASLNACNGYEHKDFISVRERMKEPNYLAQSPEIIMTGGGDERLHLIDNTGKNKYHTSAAPVTSGMIVRSSCTSSRPSLEAFDSASSLFKKFNGKLDRDQFSSLASQLRQKLKKLLSRSFADMTHAICTPSGSDAEMFFSLLALGRYKKLYDTSFDDARICNIVVTAGEVGSGTQGASALQHFSVHTPLGDMVNKGSLLNGVKSNLVESISFMTRDLSTGEVYPKNDIEQLIRQALQKQVDKENKVAVLHMVHCSKTGVGSPSFAFLKEIKKHYQDKIVIVIDAAQGRFADHAVETYLRSGMCVLFTGSKFFAGAPFSGVVLLPDTESDVFKTGPVFAPAGLYDYFSAYEVDDSLIALKQALKCEANVGLLLRWQTGLYEMERFYAIAEQQRSDIVKTWVSSVKDIMASYSAFTLLDEVVKPTEMAESDFVLGGVNSVVSFVVRNDKGHFFNVSDLKRIHKYMALDISSVLPENADQALRKIAATQCLIGQPVQIAKDYGVLRVALSAPMVSTLAVDTKVMMQKFADQDRIIFDKLQLIVEYFSSLTKSL